MTRAELESFIVAESRAAWADLIEMDRERGGSGELHHTAVSLVRGRTMIAVHCDYRSDDMLTSWFELPEPLLPDMREPLAEFLVDLHAWLEGKQPAPKLPVPEQPRVLH
jgi:hypothetical protein